MVGFKDVFSSFGQDKHTHSSSDSASLGSKNGKDGYPASSFASPVGIEKGTAADPNLNPGELTFEEGTVFCH